MNVPHDWAITSSFSPDNDTPAGGKTGGLFFANTGWYRLHFDVPSIAEGRRVELRFDGAMSHPTVYVNGEKAGSWEYGYNAFTLDITPYVKATDNVLAVRLYNEKGQSRWYPGAGLYRNVHLLVTDRAHIPTWGVQVTTPDITDAQARVNVKTAFSLPEGAAGYSLTTHIVDPQGREVASSRLALDELSDTVADETLTVDAPQRWDLDTPRLYRAVSRLYRGDRLCDSVVTRFGIRSIEVVAHKGFLLNSRVVKFKGINNHDDLGPLGAALNESALRRRLLMLKDVGANVVRTAHNMPSPELVRLCDEMGLMVIAESFDEWAGTKVSNGYHKYFNEWSERDLTNLLRHFRNAPSVVMWSIGNEVPEQYNAAQGTSTTRRLRDIYRREDPTRPVTMGMDAADQVVANGVAAALDVPGFNYRPHKYQNNYNNLPQKVVLGSESASTVSSRGIYKFPVRRGAMVTYDDNQASSYDVECCRWSNLPEDDWVWHDEKPWTMGEFVWTGFDYLGEPTPYDTDWPCHSSYFGMIDLANIPKDRYYLYRSHWNPTQETLHILPHWTWPGREGEVTPVFVYTNYPSAELFVNGKSQGRVTKNLSVTVENSASAADEQALKRQKRYRLMWPDVKYEPGTLRVVAYDADGRAVAEKEVHIAGEPYRLEAVADTFSLRAGTDDLCYIRVRMLDAEGNLVPDADHLVRFAVNGAGAFRAAANGDATCTDPFQEPQMHLFSGELTAIVATTGAAGSFTFTAEADGVLPATVGRTVDEGPVTSVDRLQAPGSPAIRLSAGIITVESATPCRVAVYATDGRCVARGRGNRVDVRHLPAGIYVVHAANAGGTAHLKAALTR